VDLIGAVSAVTANQWIYGLVDGIVEECEIFLTTADGGPARDFYGRRPDQQRSAELKFDFDTVFLEQIIFFLLQFLRNQRDLFFPFLNRLFGDSRSRRFFKHFPL
jgi:hypothetical protein